MQANGGQFSTGKMSRECRGKVCELYWQGVSGKSTMTVNWTGRFELDKGLVVEGFLCHVNMNDVILCTPESH